MHRQTTQKCRQHIAAVLLAFCMALSITACSSGGGSSGSSSELGVSSIDSYESYSNYTTQSNSAAVGGTNGEASESSDKSALTPEQNDRKIVYRASLSLESTDFETHRQALISAVEANDGYLESADYGGSEEHHNRYASFTARIPVDNYSAFLEAASNTGNLVSLNENAEDITANYIDVQARLTSLQQQKERLNQLADQAQTTADLLEIENQISNIQYQIENYTQQVRAMDDKVTYSTVDISLDEVYVLTPKTATFMDRLTVATVSGWRDFILLVQNLILAIMYSLPTLVAICIIVAICIVLLKKRKKRQKLPQKQEMKYSWPDEKNALLQPKYANNQNPDSQKSDSQ